MQLKGKIINLLPIGQKTELFQEKKLKKIIIFYLVFSFALICLALILLSIGFYFESKLVFQETILEQRQREFESSKIKVLKEEIVYLNDLFSIIDEFEKKSISLIAPLQDLNNLMPSNLGLNSLNFNKATREFTLNGFSPTREALLEFKENLENHSSFEEIFFSHSNWVEPVDINFLVRFKVKEG